MKRFIIITPEGKTQAPNARYEINNLQVVGIVENVQNEEEAIKKLLIENDSIIDAEFNVAEFIVYQIL
ncbi:hypothetical protein [Runella slithyformis]|uniref:Uncharacterized protein n=1 Tax=Runella slithyformis (strain ATCC 29530 / DSM 19594 / LMG 11500 / NCIMB 11436 / LSU 4) TaxID=761193 RepID=A0A7U4E7W5_RUNSL|nr:hypothetical protein [Runella slithyformis]AEI50743.1 hypothetical protein Runsl_4414 [Runella slithyformis DSM 19594]